MLYEIAGLSLKLFISLQGFKRILSGSLRQKKFLTEYITFQTSSLTQVWLFTQASHLVINLSTWTSKQWPKASKIWELHVQGQPGIQVCFSWSSWIQFLNQWAEFYITQWYYDRNANYDHYNYVMIFCLPNASRLQKILIITSSRFTGNFKREIRQPNL